MLSGILSNMCSNILSGSLSGILSGIYVRNLSSILPTASGAIWTSAPAVAHSRSIAGKGDEEDEVMRSTKWRRRGARRRRRLHLRSNLEPLTRQVGEKCFVAVLSSSNSITASELAVENST